MNCPHLSSIYTLPSCTVVDIFKFGCREASTGTGEVTSICMSALPCYNFVCCTGITTTPITNCSVVKLEADAAVFIVRCRRRRQHCMEEVLKVALEVALDWVSSNCVVSTSETKKDKVDTLCLEIDYCCGQSPNLYRGKLVNPR